MNLKNNTGSALVEMAIMLPLLLLIVFGIFEFGRAMYISNTLNNAAREGSRRASVSDPFNKALVEDHVRSSIPTSLNPLLAVITITPEMPLHGIDAVKVVVELPFTTVVPLIIPQLNNVTLSGEASMRYE